ncbi:MAG: dockerin type I repeat-containing protein [Candidatus Latescibacteria bacterium]|nr:dockerin type I repeat-containing protein [Candidatus Latescibacterota bacterium]
MRSLFVLIFALSMIACSDGDRRPENQSSNPLYPSGLEQVQRGRIVPDEGSVVSEAEVVVIDAERLVVLARAPVDDQGRFEVSVPQRPSYWLGVSGPYMTTYINTAFAFTGEAIIVGEAPQSHVAGKAVQAAGILGDVNNDDQVDIADALLVLLYTLERISFAAPNQGNIALGDVNEDSQIDLADVLLIMTYIADPLDPTLPDGIGLDSMLPDGIGLTSDRDRAALISLYKATGGVDWWNNTNWLINNAYSLDQWYGVETDDEGRVTNLYLSGNELTGCIPSALQDVRYEGHDLYDLELSFCW